MNPLALSICLKVCDKPWAKPLRKNCLTQTRVEIHRVTPTSAARTTYGCVTNMFGLGRVVPGGLRGDSERRLYYACSLAVSDTMT